MNERREFLKLFMCRLDFPLAAQKTFLEAFDCIEGDRVACAWFSSLLQQYEKSEHCSYKQMLSDMKTLGETLGIHEYTSGMLMFMCMTEKLRERYAERGIDQSIYDHTMREFSYKLDECQRIHGIVGCAFSWWTPGFFDMTRFAFGRLQFELIATKGEHTVDGVVIPVGSKVINMHIPNTGGPLDHEAVLESYRQAAAFFAEEIGDNPVVFTCHSWLLDPWHLTALPEESNIVRFARDFTIVNSGPYGAYNEAWRIFGKPYSGDVESLPRASTLQRVYAQRIARGEPMCWGQGFFVYKK